jgi:hypothetical protein
MPHDKVPPSKGAIEATHPHAVWIRIPPIIGLARRLNYLHDVAISIGSYATVSRAQGKTDFVRFGFARKQYAALFRARAVEIAGIVVEHGEPFLQEPNLGIATGGDSRALATGVIADPPKYRAPPISLPGDDLRRS